MSEENTQVTEVTPIQDAQINETVESPVTENKTEEVIEKTEAPVVEEKTEEPEKVEPEKIKIGEKEYTPSEIEQLIQAKEEPKPEFRPVHEIQQEVQSLTQQCNNDFTSFAQRFLQKSTASIEETGYSAQDLFAYGQQTGDFTQFIATLTPLDAIAFENERLQNAFKYNQLFEKLGKELNQSHFNEKKLADARKYEEFKARNAESIKTKGDEHLLNYIQKNYEFDESAVSEFFQVYKEARELEANEAALNSQTQDGKNRMMNSPVNGGNVNPSDNYGGIPRSWAEIGKKGQAFYNQNARVIDEMDSKGLITA